MIDDVRKHKRLEMELDINWSIESQNLSGKGKLLDVSVPGACFRIEQPFVAKSGLIFTLEAPEIPALPKHGRLRWYRKLPGRNPVFLCGVIFEGGDHEAWIQWLDQTLAQPA
jgi:hypothetical protein